jgi:metal-dependent amidase/aminoacylase/carboxypeptidase family protein
MAQCRIRLWIRYWGAQLVVALNTIASRNTDPLMPVVVSQGSFKAGDTFI